MKTQLRALAHYDIQLAALRPRGGTPVVQRESSQELGDRKAKRGVLPFQAENPLGWDASLIAGNISQYDGMPSTLTDKNRCLATSVLVIRIMGGVDSVSKLAADIARKIGIYSGSMGFPAELPEEHKTTLINYRPLLMTVPSMLKAETAGYQHLHWLADAMHLISFYGTEVGSGAKSDRAIELGGGKSEDVIGENGTGFADLEKLLAKMATGALKDSKDWAYLARMTSSGGGHAFVIGKAANGRVYYYDPDPVRGWQIQFYPGGAAMISHRFLEYDKVTGQPLPPCKWWMVRKTKAPL